MRLLLDQGLPRRTASLLRDQGIDAVHTAEIRLETATDDRLLIVAEDQERVVVTLDADFHALMALSGASLPSVIRIRIEGLRAEPLARLLSELLDDWNSELEAGVLLTVQPSRVRLRRLPLSPAVH